jgi:hypothetical protein
MDRISVDNMECGQHPQAPGARNLVARAVVIGYVPTIYSISILPPVVD